MIGGDGQENWAVADRVNHNKIDDKGREETLNYRFLLLHVSKYFFASMVMGLAPSSKPSLRNLVFQEITLSAGERFIACNFGNRRAGPDVFHLVE